MKTFPHLMACADCDCLFHRRPLRAGEQARCTRCGAVLRQQGNFHADRAFSLAITAGITWGIANGYPLLTVTLHGVNQSVTLWQSASAFADGPLLLLAITTLLLLSVVPLLQIILCGWLAFFAASARPAPGFIGCMKLSALLRPWNRTEIALLGFLVAAIKLSSLLEVVPGPGCLALALLMLLNLLLSRQPWDALWQLPSPEYRCET
ncbi:paraquat-inducible protein A [Pantoea sp. B65]|uniref:paraquat-inducible protein A n=1 Tax=Pantoea sp. B65 TaxID=2813359 RepID=UPI0039B4AB88